MKFLQKILFVIMIGLVAGNTDVKGMIPLAGPVPGALPALIPGNPILDFDTIFGAANPVISAPLQPTLYIVPVAGAPNRRCVYFTIFQPDEVEDVNFVHAVARNPNINDNNIYFPLDGHQPTTTNAVAWSCANIDNRENSPITNWYMMMFGVIPVHPNVFVQAGWDADAANAQRIITFNNDACVDANNDNNHNLCAMVNNDPNHIVDDPSIPGAKILRIDLFEREFRKIASTSVGRVLLYRILIEIRRHNPGGNVGCTEIADYAPSNIHKRARNNYRNLKINFGHEFSFANDQSSIQILNKLLTLTAIGKSNIAGYTHIVSLNGTPISVSIFHEMLHWFHSLRHIKRTQDEYENTNPERDFQSHPIGKYYWSRLNKVYANWSGKIHSSSPWHDGDNKICFEEIRTILGFSCDTSTPDYLQGDDLSENLYRMCIGFPIRFGYGYQGFYEDRKVTNRVINSCVGSYVYYVGGSNVINRREQIGMGYDNPETIEFKYNDKHSLKGLGKFKGIPYGFHIVNPLLLPQMQ